MANSKAPVEFVLALFVCGLILFASLVVGVDMGGNTFLSAGDNEIKDSTHAIEKAREARPARESILVGT